MIKLEYLSLFSKIGSGRVYHRDESGSIYLHFSHGAGRGVVIDLVVDSVPGQIWFSESEWLEWCNDIVHFSDIEAIPISLKDILATWVLGDFFFGHKIIIKQITTLVLLDGFYPQATINSEDKNIAMVMLSTPLSFLSFFWEW
nr:SepQ [Edwardsiella sp. EA181011]